MSKLVLPREAKARRQSRLKDSSARKAETRAMMSRLVQSAEYPVVKKMAAAIAASYRADPGRTQEEDVSYLKHCNILWGFNSLFRQIEDLAKIQPRTIEDANEGW